MQTDDPPSIIELPILGACQFNAELNWYESERHILKMLDGKPVRFICPLQLLRMAQPLEIDTAIRQLIANSSSLLKDAELHIFDYYRDVQAHVSPEDDLFPQLDAPHEVWKQVEFGDAVNIGYDDFAMYFIFECGCAWEPEHGLQITVRNGETVSRISPCDGHLTNEQAYGRGVGANTMYVRSAEITRNMR